MSSFVVTYPVTADHRFDADYYVDTHIPLVREALSSHGLLSARALLPTGSQPYAAIAILDFRDDAARDAALASPDAKRVMGDVPNFTDIRPVAMLCG